MTSLIDRLLGPSIRRIGEAHGSTKVLYLTFDDGPNPISTPKVLETLKNQGVSATFFVIVKKALEQRSMLQQITESGHTIGNHSLDHKYRSFFQGRTKILNWIRESEDILNHTLNIQTVGFRPPAGVRTPELAGALKQLQIPLILWNKRFFDAHLPLNKTQALRSLSKTASGSIILLHDSQAIHRIAGFVNTLSLYIDQAKSQGFEFRALSRDLCLPSSLKSKLN